jgi:hypothetical protein
MERDSTIRRTRNSPHRDEASSELRDGIKMSDSMKAKLVVAFSALVVSAVAGLSAAAGSTSRPQLRVIVRPAVGFPTTSFVLTVQAPGRGAAVRDFVVSATVSSAATGCVASVYRRVVYSRRRVGARIRLNQSLIGGSWCPGTYHGQVEETQRAACAPHAVCPTVDTSEAQFVIQVKPTAGSTSPPAGTTLPPGGTTPPPAGTTPPGGGDSTPPAFGGIESAFACTPGPQYPGETTPFNLTWKAAADDVTLSQDIVYDVYASTTSGGENFSQPSWTTPPGVTSFRTPGLPSHGTFYFVVRARDQAGNEDQNTHEVLGMDPCV